jgi:hypothetical protein
MATFAELLTILRVRLGDTAAPPLYDDAACAIALNDAQRQAAIRKRLILDNSTPTSAPTRWTQRQRTPWVLPPWRSIRACWRFAPRALPAVQPAAPLS